MGVVDVKTLIFLYGFLSNYCTAFRCCCTRGTARSNNFYWCCNEAGTHQTEFFSRLIPWHVLSSLYLLSCYLNVLCASSSLLPKNIMLSAYVCWFSFSCSSAYKIILLLSYLSWLCFLVGLYAMHIQLEQIYYGQACQWLLCLLRKWLLESLGHSVSRPDSGRRWLLAGEFMI